MDPGTFCAGRGMDRSYRYPVYRAKPWETFMIDAKKHALEHKCSLVGSHQIRRGSSRLFEFSASCGSKSHLHSHNDIMDNSMKQKSMSLSGLRESLHLFWRYTGQYSRQTLRTCLHV